MEEFLIPLITFMNGITVPMAMSMFMKLKRNKIIMPSLQRIELTYLDYLILQLFQLTIEKLLEAGDALKI